MNVGNDVAKQTQIGNKYPGEKRDISNNNITAVSGIFCANPRYVAAHTKAAIPGAMIGKNSFHPIANINPSIPPSIIDGVIRPPDAPATIAKTTANHFVTNKPIPYCQFIEYVKLS